MFLPPPPPLPQSAPIVSKTSWKHTTRFENEILEVLIKNPEIKANTIALKLQITNDSFLRIHLADLIEKLILTRTRNGYMVL